MMHRMLTILVGAALWAATAFAELTITVQAGAGGTIRADCIAPVQVQFENPDNDLRGDVEVAFLRGGSDIASARMPLDLPRNSRKSVFLYVPATPDHPDTVRVRFLEAGRYSIAELAENLNVFDASLPMFAAIGNYPEGLPAPETDKQKQRYARLLLTTDRVPRSWEGLQMYDAFLIVPPLDDPLDLEQVTALREWVFRGGLLFVDVSEPRDAYATGALNSLLPLIPLGIETATLDPIAKPAQRARCDHRSGEVLLGSRDQPLVVRENIGLGAVTCFAIAPASPEFTSWEGCPALWAKLLEGIDLDRAENDPMFRNFENQTAVLSELVVAKESGAVRLGAVFILIAIYALAIGPGDRWLVKRLGRPHLTWITFPSLVLGFTLAAWFGAKYFVGGEMSSAAASRILIAPEHGLAAQYDVVSLFAPRTARYHLKLDSGAMIGQLRSEFLIEQDALARDLRDNSLTFLIPSWQQRVFAGSATISNAPKIDVETIEENGVRSVNVTNNTGSNLSDVRVYFSQHQYFHSAPIEPGATARVPLEQAALAGFTRVLSSRGAFMDAARQQDISAALREFDADGALARGALIVCAQTASAPNPLIVDGQPRTESCSRVIEIVVYPEFSTQAEGESQP